MKSVSNVKIFGLPESILASGYPMKVNNSLGLNWNSTTTNDIERAKKLADSPIGAGHDNFLNGIIVQFDLSFTNKAWVEAERYHFLDFVSSQSTMHRITKFDLNKAYCEYVDDRIIEIMKEKVVDYNNTVNKTEKKRKYLEILYSNPAGFIITARMTTNYRQLKTIYKQRRSHLLPDWQDFCNWIEELPYSELIIGEHNDGDDR